MEQTELPVSVIVRQAFDIVYSEDALWSSQTVYSADRVTITNNAEVELDVDQTASKLTVERGRLNGLETGKLTITESLNVQSQGAVSVSAGEVKIEGGLVVNDGLIQLNGGSMTVEHVGAGSPDSRQWCHRGHRWHFWMDGWCASKCTSGQLKLSSNWRYGESIGAGLRGSCTIHGDFEVVGDDASISMVRLNMNGNIKNGTAGFVLDADGVSPIIVPGWMNLGAATIVVDGSQYTGGPADIVLVDSNNLVASPPASQMTVTGFEESGRTATIVADQTNGKD